MKNEASVGPWFSLATRKTGGRFLRVTNGKEQCVYITILGGVPLTASHVNDAETETFFPLALAPSRALQRTMRESFTEGNSLCYCHTRSLLSEFHLAEVARILEIVPHLA